LNAGDLLKMEPHYPLDVYVCDRCFLVQIEEYEKAQDIFNADYAYFSSYSDSWLDHCRLYVDMMMKRFRFDRKSRVLEIASNDGYLLQFFLPHNVSVLGIEPATNAAEVARKKGIPTDVAYFDSTYAARWVAEGNQADLIIGNNVLAHNPNVVDFVKALKIALKPRGLMTLEFPHLMRLIEETQFDTIYHEHFSYFSFFVIEKIFASQGLMIFDVDELSTHGGSLRIYACHQGDETKRVESRVKTLRDQEMAKGYTQLGVYLAFHERIKAVKRDILRFLIQVKDQGKKVVGYGAPAKGNTLLNYCGIRTDFLDYTVDRSPHKQNRYLPGSHIPIVYPDQIRTDQPDYVLILPWNIKDEIMTQMGYIRQWGGKFVIPIPRIEVID
jgi:2-polyprenyl-3-methyl-5-hydroxy-6-metoxy-1,4-benzoquinol methylase